MKTAASRELLARSRYPAAARRLGRRRHVPRRARLSRRAARRTQLSALELYRQVADRVRDVRRPWRRGPHPLRDGLDTPREQATPRSPAATSSSRCRRTPTSRACAASGFHSSGWRLPRPPTAVPSAPRRSPPQRRVLAQEEGIVVVYSDETPGRELVEQGRAALSATELARATEFGQQLTVPEILELVRHEARAPA